MLRLGAFGGISLTRDGRPVLGAAVAPRPLALLILVAAGGERGVSRDTIAGLLWPDSDLAASRHSLHQTLHRSREALGASDLCVGTTSLLLNPACIEVDIWDFDAAMRARQLEHAVRLYRGPFADGFSIRGAPEVERRLEALRAGFARQLSEAIEALACAAAERRNYLESARWWQRLVDEDRLSARAAKELVGALVAAGEAARALQFALVHTALVRQETGRRPDPEIEQWIQRLRGGDSGASPQPPSQPRAPVRAADGALDDVVENARRRRTARLANVIGRRYRIERLLEEGSITASYAAHATEGIGREVEVHLVQPLVATTGSSHFISSMSRTKTLADGRILPTIEVGAADDFLFYVTGRRCALTLRERLHRERALPKEAALKIALDIAAALAHAHSRGVHHGDLRPKHVGLAADCAIVGGFGVVEALVEAPGPAARTTIVALGSPSYLSPEQLADNVHADARSDIYALGCILYEMLAGEPPFGRRSRALVTRKLTEGPPQLRRYRDSVSEELEHAIQKCLMRVPADRYASVEEAAQSLGESMGRLSAKL